MENGQEIFGFMEALTDVWRTNDMQDNKRRLVVIEFVRSYLYAWKKPALQLEGLGRLVDELRNLIEVEKWFCGAVLRLTELVEAYLLLRREYLLHRYITAQELYEGITTIARR